MSNYLNEAKKYFHEGNWALADIYCQLALKQGVPAWDMAAMIAQRLGNNYAAGDFYRKSLGLGLDAGWVPPEPKGFLLCKAWGYGFWSDVEQIMTAVLFCEIFGRIPIIYWGGSSCYNSTPWRSSFGDFFKPINQYSLEDVMKDELSFFPSKWNISNVKEENINKWEGENSRLSLHYFMNKKEDVLVYDYFTQFWVINHWLPYGYNINFSGVFKKYFAIQDDIQARIDNFYAENMTGKEILAVHWRNNDKDYENKTLNDLQSEIRQAVKEKMAANPNIFLFLLTDNIAATDEFKNLYPERIILTPAKRAQGGVNITYEDGHDYTELGKEILIDTILATKCQYFIGLGSSNVSCVINKLGSFKESKLFGFDVHYLPLISLYNSESEQKVLIK